MHTLFHIILIFLCVVMYFNILKHMDYIHNENTHDNNSFVIEYQNNRELQYLCDKDKVLIFDSPYHIDYDGIINLSNTSDNEVIKVPFNAFIKLQKCKNDLYYFSNSTPILDEHIELSNRIINPLSIHKKCHLLGGPQGYITPVFFHNFHRKFLYVSSGSIQISIQPLNSTHIIDKDIATLQYSVGNCDISDNETIFLNSGQIIFIPHNYIYNIEYREPVNVVYDITCHSISSFCLNIKDILLNSIQKNNVIVKQDIDSIIEDNDTISQSDNNEELDTNNIELEN